MISSDPASPAEASSHTTKPTNGFAQAGKPGSTFRDHAPGAGGYERVGAVAVAVRGTMFSHRSLAVPALLAGLLSFVTPSQAVDLNGLWSSDPALCDKIFTKKGKQVVFSPLSDLYGSGFIIDGSRIRGKVARCTIKSRKQDGDTLLLSATCSTIIAPQDLEFSLQVVDDNTVARVFPGSSAMRVNFHRCPP